MELAFTLLVWLAVALSVGALVFLTVVGVRILNGTLLEPKSNKKKVWEKEKAYIREILYEEIRKLEQERRQ